MPDIAATLAELDRLHAAATPGEWFFVAHMTDEESMKSGGTSADVVVAPEDEDSSPVSVIDYPSDADAELIATLHNAYPTLRSHITELEAKAAGLDLIRDLFHRFDTRFAGARDQVLLTDDLLERTREAIESAVKKETKQ